MRDTWEIPLSRVKIDKRRWNQTMLPVLDRPRADPGLPDGTRLTAELQSMLVYAVGRDPDRSDRRVLRPPGTIRWRGSEVEAG